MKPSWLFETDVFDEGIKRLVREVRRQGMRAEVCRYVPLRDGETYLDIFPPNECVVFYGTLGFAEQIRDEAPWRPGVYYNRPAYDCSTYYPALGRFLLAQDYVMLPYGDLARRKAWLYEHLGQEGAVFVRPDTGHKLFTGSLVYEEHFDVDTEHMVSAEVKPSELVVVSPPRNVVHEWRFVAVDDRVVAGSQYREDGHRSWRRQYPDEALRLAGEVAATGYRPDRAWTIDICQTTSGAYYLLEIGTFCCAGLYACAEEPVVREVSRVALEDWSK